MWRREGGGGDIQITNSPNDVETAPKRSVRSVSIKRRDNFEVTELMIFFVERIDLGGLSQKISELFVAGAQLKGKNFVSTQGTNQPRRHNKFFFKKSGRALEEDREGEWNRRCLWASPCRGCISFKG
jgi:hypothetical protein